MIKLSKTEVLLLKNIQLRKSLAKQIAANIQLELHILKTEESSIVDEIRKNNELPTGSVLSIDLDNGSASVHAEPQNITQNNPATKSTDHG